MMQRLLAVAVAVLLSGCFWFGPKSAPVAGGYSLMKWEDFETYYLVESSRSVDEGGVLQGSVIRIGWDTNHIIAERSAAIGGERGWMHVDVAARRVSGPFAWADLTQRVPDATRIQIYDAAEAWRTRR